MEQFDCFEASLMLARPRLFRVLNNLILFYDASCPQRLLIEYMCSVFVASWTGVIKYHGPRPSRGVNKVSGFDYRVAKGIGHPRSVTNEFQSFCSSALGKQ